MESIPEAEVIRAVQRSRGARVSLSRPPTGNRCAPSSPLNFWWRSSWGKMLWMLWLSAICLPLAFASSSCPYGHYKVSRLNIHQISRTFESGSFASDFTANATPSRVAISRFVICGRTLTPIEWTSKDFSCNFSRAIDWYFKMELNVTWMLTCSRVT